MCDNVSKYRYNQYKYICLEETGDNILHIMLREFTAQTRPARIGLGADNYHHHKQCNTLSRSRSP